jgi:hypothetical protein
MDPGQQAAVLAQYPAGADIIDVRSPELALSGTRLPARIRRNFTSGQELVIVVHEGCQHLTSHYTTKVRDTATRRRVSKRPSAQELNLRRNNHLWIGIQCLRYAIRHARRTRDQELAVTILLVGADNSVTEINPTKPIR